MKKANTDSLLSGVEAAKYLGVSRYTLHSLVNKGDIKPLMLAGRPVYTRESLERVKLDKFRKGLGHREIAAMYGRPRANVAYHFKQQGVQPIGIDNHRRGATIYDLATVQMVAAMLGWVEVRQNQTDEELDLAHAEA